ncbi:MAG: sensor histidine kinase [Pseudomonadota bacterium]
MTLATRTALLLSGIFTLVFAVAVMVALHYFEARYVFLAGQHQLTTLQGHADSLEGKISTVHTTLVGAGKLVDSKLLAAPQEAQRFLDARTFLQRNFQKGLFLFDTQGRLVIASPANLSAKRGTTLTDTEIQLVQRVLNLRTPQVSAPFAIPGGPKEPLIALSAPLFGPDQNLIGVIQGSLELLDSNYAGGLAQVKVGDTGYLSMLTRDRIMLLHPDSTRKLGPAAQPGQNKGLDRAINEHFQGTTETVNSRGGHALATYVELKSLGWILASNFPMAEVRRPFRESLNAVAGFAVVASLLLFLLITLLVRRLLLPVRLLTQHLSAVGLGKAQPLALPPTGDLGLLAQAYNQMLADLQVSEAARMDGERQLRELNADLEQRVRERTEELETTNTELTQTLDTNLAIKNELVRSEKLAALGNLVAGLAHELNTPVGNALLAASALRARTQDIGDRMDAGAIKRSDFNEYKHDSIGAALLVEKNLQRAASLIDNFKQVAVDQTAEHRRTFDVDQTIEEVVSTLEYQVRMRPITVHMDLRADVHMDSYPGPLGQLIVNFFTNALMHAFPAQTSGNIWISCARQGEDSVQIAFKDDGCGIPAANLQKVFDPFFTTRLGQGGSGLGLSIAFNIATSMLGGTLALASAEGQGTTFTVVLPRVAPGMAAS